MVDDVVGLEEVLVYFLSVKLGRLSCARCCSVWSIVSLSLADSSSSAIVFCSMVSSRCLKKMY